MDRQLRALLCRGVIMRTITLDVFQFDELSDSAKEKAREWYRGCDCGDYLDYIVEDFKAIGKIIGLEVSNVFYSVGFVQSDYAAFVGTWRYAKGCMAAIKEYAPTDAELHNIVSAWCDLQRKHFYRVSAECVCRRDWQAVDGVDVGGWYVLAVHDSASEISRDLSSWLYHRLRDEVEYKNSDETVDESIRANEYEFYADGS